VAPALAAAVLWGTTGTAASFAPAVSPLAIGATAMGIGGLLQAVIAVHDLRRYRPLLVRRWSLVLTAALAVAVYPLAFYTSMRLAGIAVGTVLTIGLAPLSSAVIERVVDRVHLTRRWIAGAALGLGGTAALAAGRSAPGTATGHGGVAVLGVGLGVLAAAGYAVYSWAAHRLMWAGTSPRAAMGASFGLGGLLLVPVVIVAGRPLLAGPTPLAVGAYLALIPMFGGYLFYGAALGRVRASVATTATLLESVVAAVLAVLVAGEALSPLAWLGAALVLTTLVVLTLRIPGRRRGVTPACASG
jgi:DME family drug/metabolite transporter